MGRRLDNARALYLEGIRDGDCVDAIEAYAGGRYTQHSTPVEDGKEGFKRFFADFVERYPIRDIEIVRGFEDGSYVFLHAVQTLNDGELRYVTADIFDTDHDAKLVEHWDVIDEIGEPNPSGRTPIDGPTEPCELGATEANKDLVARFVAEVLATGEHGRMDEFVSVDLVQHGPHVGDGIQAFRAYAAGTSLRYVEVHLVVGSGDLVAVLAESELDGSSRAVIDLYRVEGGRIAEHWEVAEEITPEDTWVNSGKF